MAGSEKWLIAALSGFFKSKCNFSDVHQLVFIVNFDHFKFRRLVRHMLLSALQILDIYSQYYRFSSFLFIYASGGALSFGFSSLARSLELAEVRFKLAKSWQLHNPAVDFARELFILS